MPKKKKSRGKGSKDSPASRPTLKDIAELVGCSQNTVSLGLRDSPRLSLKTKRRIREVARRQGYVPSLTARRLRSRRSGLIGIFALGLYDAVRIDMVNHLIAELRTADYQPMLGLADERAGDWLSCPWIDTFRSLDIEALVVVSEKVTKLPAWSRTIPVILSGTHPRDALACDYLALERREAVRMAFEHVVDRGHRNILVGGELSQTFSRECVRLCRSRGIRYQRLAMHRMVTEDAESLRRMGRQMVGKKGHPTAVVSASSAHAAVLMQGVLDAGATVPDDVAFVGYDYLPWADSLPVPLTTVEQPIDVMAPRTVTMVRERLSDPAIPWQHDVLPHKLVVRESS